MGAESWTIIRWKSSTWWGVGLTRLRRLCRLCGCDAKGCDKIRLRGGKTPRRADCALCLKPRALYQDLCTLCQDLLALCQEPRALCHELRALCQDLRALCQDLRALCQEPRALCQDLRALCQELRAL